ncbi:hypothetical protein SS50377_27960 [Spironucleus salmonicida]|uniref:Uncharacterized protein n=1 Tax=Spironucleus salmonicida TaxID=348837 RepID=A0A9P8RUR0_9EUKA|nr:hypothetical protein SS50377_27960 [Spironucleus salmonicida]
MQQRTALIVCAAVLAVLLAARHYVARYLQHATRSAPPQLQRLAREHPDCVPEGTVFDLAHLDRLRPRVLQQFRASVHAKEE